MFLEVFLLTFFEKKFNKTIAILFPSVFFAVVHLYGSNLDFVSFIFLLIGGTTVGVLFSLITIETNSIWNSIFVHSIWNMIMIGGVYHIGEASYISPIYSYFLRTESIFITGGKFGIEASIISLIGYIICITFALLRIKNKPIEEKNS